MEDKIEVGEYVRTKNGLIGTLIEISEAGSGVRYAGEFITDKIFSIYTKPHTEVRLKDRDIAKHSKNIKKLIDVGDIVEVLLKEKLQKSLKEGVDEAMNLVFKKYGLVGVVSVLLRVMKCVEKKGGCLN